MSDVEPTEPELATGVCPDCGEVITGRTHGPRSLASTIAMHRVNAHKYRSPHRGPRSEREKSARQAERERAERPTVVNVVEDIAEELDTGKKGPPTVDELRNALGKGLYLFTYATAMTAVDTDPVLKNADKAVKDHWTAYLSLNQTGARDVAAPVARVIGKSRLNKRAGRQIVENVELVGTASALTILGVHWHEYLGLRRAAALEAGGPAGGPAYPAPRSAPPAPASDGPPAGGPPMAAHIAGNGSSGHYAPPDPGSGVVLTFDDIQRMRGAG
jgi:predicted RNA-binding Zn-ribbon protein involved in translation (DUF1610 family)